MLVKLPGVIVVVPGIKPIALKVTIAPWQTEKVFAVNAVILFVLVTMEIVCVAIQPSEFVALAV